MGRPSDITEDMEDFIRGELDKTPRPKAACIFQRLTKQLEEQGKDCPGEGAIIKRITKLRKEADAHPPSGLDAPWTVGSCMKNNIPSGMIPILLGEQRRSIALNQEMMQGAGKLSKDKLEFRQQLAKRKLLTIRQAKWAALLWPALVANATKQMPKDSDPLLFVNRIFVKAKLYAYRERIAEIKGVEYLDTSDDDVLIGDFSDPVIRKDILTYTGVLDDADKKHHILLDGTKQGQKP